MVQRGASVAVGALTAEVAIAVFKVAFGRWVTETTQTDLSGCIRASFDQLKTVTAAT